MSRPPWSPTERTGGIPGRCVRRRMALTRTLQISNDLGLHARAAAKIVELAGRFDAQLYLSKDGNEVEGGSILSILSLACPKGTELAARTDGKEAEALMDALCHLFEERFGEAS